MKKIIFLSVVLGILTACNCNQNQPKSQFLSEASPESAGLSSARLSLIDSMLTQAVEQNKIPGAVALVARHGKIVFHKAFGMADNQSGRVMKKDDIFRIASQTKALTATAVMILWEEGKFRLDDPISMYIPEFKTTGVLKDFNPKDSSFTTTPPASEITIRELLTHTSGVGYGMIDGDERFRKIFMKAGIIDAFTTADVSTGDNIRKLAKMPLHFNPGEKFSYSEGLDILAYLVELKSGMPFDKFLKSRIFDPLGMKDTWFYLPEDKAARLVSVQHPENGKWVKYPVTLYDPDYPVKGAKRYFAGGAGLSSTAFDYATFLQMYLNGGELNGARILSRTTIKAIMGNQNTKIWGEDAESYYGLAFGVTTKRGQEKGGSGSAGTFSWGGYFNTMYFADPAEGVTGILMKQTQDTNSDDTGWKFSQLVGASVND
jgi:CubicO group peptidase (beta-lactamase class C family)